MDGIAIGMEDYDKDHDEYYTFRISEEKQIDIVKLLKITNTDIFINFFAVGSQKATEFYANVCIEAKVAFLNCIPVFIASGPTLGTKIY